MTIEIPNDKWKRFFDDLSKRRFGWETKIEVLDESVGDQILSDGLPLNGIIFEERSGRRKIEISVGETTEQHMTHTIPNPTRIAYLGKDDFSGGVIAIEEQETGVKTLISLINPMPVFAGYSSYQMVAASQEMME
jgi:hypothetical protein